MTGATPPHEKLREAPLPIFNPIPFLTVEFRDGIGLRMSNGISPCFFAFQVELDRPSLNPF